jgi:hypothetical protein
VQDCYCQKVSGEIGGCVQASGPVFETEVYDVMSGPGNRNAGADYDNARMLLGLDMCRDDERGLPRQSLVELGVVRSFTPRWEVELEQRGP